MRNKVKIILILIISLICLFMCNNNFKYKSVINNKTYYAGPYYFDSEDVNFSDSSLSAKNVKAAVNELYQAITDGCKAGYEKGTEAAGTYTCNKKVEETAQADIFDSSNVKYRNSGSGLIATNVKAAIIEIASKIPNCKTGYNQLNVTSNSYECRKTITVTAKNQTITYEDNISTGTNQITITGLPSGYTVSSITLTPSTLNATQNGSITPSDIVIKDSIDNNVTSSFVISYVNGTLIVNKHACTLTTTAKTVTTGNTLNLSTAANNAKGTLSYALKSGGNNTTTASTISNGILTAGAMSSANDTNQTVDVVITDQGNSNYNGCSKDVVITVQKKSNTTTAKNGTVYVSSTTALSTFVENNNSGSLSASITTDNTAGSSISGTNLVAGVLTAGDDSNKTVVLSITSARTTTVAQKTVSATVTVQKYTRTLSWATGTPAANATLTYGTNNTATASVSGSGGNAGNITYASNNTTGATINSTTGAITVAKGNEQSVTITATLLGTETVKTASITRNYTTGRATGYVNLNATSGSITYGTASTTFTVSSHHGGTLSASDNNSTATCSVSNTTVTCSSLGAISAGTSITVTVTSNQTDNYTQASKTYTLTINKATCATPTNLAISTAGVVTWTASSNCSSAQHQISIDGTNWANASSGINYRSTILASTGTRTVYVKAIAPNANYNNSANATQSVTVCNAALTAGTGISAVSGAGKYISGETITINATVSTGHTWSKWTQTSGGAQVTTTQNYSTTTCNISYTANATANTYTITYNANNGSGAPGPTTYTYATSGTTNLSSTVPTRTGYTFLGWSLSSTATTADYSAGQAWALSNANNYILYAVWSVTNYTISYTLNGGSVSGNPTSYNVNTNTFTLNNPTKTGYTFLGWVGSNDLSSGINCTASSPCVAAIRDHILGNEFNVTSGSTYRVSVVAKRTAGTLDLGGGLWYTVYSEGTAYEGYNVLYTYAEPMSDGYARYYKDVTVPSGKSKAKAYLQLNQTEGGYTTSWNYYDVHAVISPTSVSIAKGSTGNKSYQATWTANTYTITYNANNGSGAPGATTYRYAPSGTTNLSSTVPTRTGHTFLGWSTSSTATTASYSAGQAWALSNAANYTLYAVWQANTYTITYNANNGSGAPGPTTYTYASSGTTNLSSTVPTRTGYTFLGWSTSSTATTADYSAGQAWALSNANNYILYAVWSVTNYTISYTLNGGSASGNPTSYNINTNTFTLNNPTRTGYTFIGWVGSNDLSSGINCTSSSPCTAAVRDHIMGNEFNVTSGQTYRVSTVAKRTAGTIDLRGGIWYTVYSEGNQWDGYDVVFTYGEPMSNGYARYYRDVTVPSGKTKGKAYLQLQQTSDNYTTSWSYYDVHVVQSPTSVSIAKGSTGNKSYQATWSANTYTITYNANGGSGAPGATTYRYAPSGTTNLSSTAPTRAGYTFLGWSTSSTATTASYSAGQAWNLSNASNYILYAVWSPNTYTVTYYPNGGSGSNTTQNVTYNTSWTTKAAIFSRTGYTLSGWSTTSSGSVTHNLNTAQGTWTSTSNLPLYAVWSPNTYTVTYYPNGGSGSNTTQNVSYNSSWTTKAAIFTKDGYTLSGWSTTSGGSVTHNLNTAQGTWTSTSNLPLYAVWTPNTYTVTYYPNGGTGSNTTQNVTYNTSWTTKDAIFTRSSYTLAGWSTTSDGGVTHNLNTAQGTWTRTSNLPLYAVWNQIYYYNWRVICNCVGAWYYIYGSGGPWTSEPAANTNCINNRVGMCRSRCDANHYTYDAVEECYTYTV